MSDACRLHHSAEFACVQTHHFPIYMRLISADRGAFIGSIRVCSQESMPRESINAMPSESLTLAYLLMQP
jgi:hypothetical protein